MNSRIFFILTVCIELMMGCDVESLEVAPPVEPPLIGKQAPDRFPAFHMRLAEEMEVIGMIDYDHTVDGQQILIQTGIAAPESVASSQATLYETYCEIAYLPVDASSSADAYHMLGKGIPETVFAFEYDIDELDFFLVKDQSIDGRSAKRYGYRFPAGIDTVVGQGLAVYFNDREASLVRSALLYFECFSFQSAFKRNADLIAGFFDSIKFGETRLGDHSGLNYFDIHDIAYSRYGVSDRLYFDG